LTGKDAALQKEVSVFVLLLFELPFLCALSPRRAAPMRRHHVPPRCHLQRRALKESAFSPQDTKKRVSVLLTHPLFVFSEV
jgi:hypothetical protein